MKNKNPQEEENTNFRVYLGENKEWLVTADQLQFILYRKSTPKKDGNKTAYRIDGYYTNLGLLLEALAMKKLRDSEVKTLKGIEKQLKLIREDIASYKMVILK